ncbi:MAG TPA: energy transducer TonB [Paludibacteraceae bacterium]|nr:energy transducer TonB [Paludibacteraceae bacterium]HQF50795.1 energy transducer TonB [Paludibacteraceae bacterium]
MEIKKSPKADLENKRNTYVLIGLVLALSFMYICFEWTESEVKKIDPTQLTQAIELEEEIAPQSVQQNTPPPPPPPPPAAVVNEVLQIVKNDEVVVSKEIKGEDTKAEIVIPQQVAAPVEEEEVEQIFTIVEEKPSFPGGDKALMEYLQKNMKYPTIAAENGIKGRVMVTFVVNKDGKIVDVKVLRGVDPSLDKEAIRVVSAMPAWKPGKQSGKPVRTQYTLPVVFRLQ